MSGKFWIEDPCNLVTNLTLLPTSGQTTGEQLNALTRLALLGGAGLAVARYKDWMTVLAIAIGIIVVLWLLGRACKKSEGFSVTPTYMSNDFEQTIVAPTYAEEWQIPPPAYDLYAEKNTECDDDVEYFTKPEDPRSYPYGQYLTDMNVLPSDEQNMRYLNGGATSAREYANSMFVRNDLGFRENMSRLYKLSLARRFRHACSDVWSPYNSY